MTHQWKWSTVTLMIMCHGNGRLGPALLNLHCLCSLYTADQMCRIFGYKNNLPYCTFIAVYILSYFNDNVASNQIMFAAKDR